MTTSDTHQPADEEWVSVNDHLDYGLGFVSSGSPTRSRPASGYSPSSRWPGNAASRLRNEPQTRGLRPDIAETPETLVHVNERVIR